MGQEKRRIKAERKRLIKLQNSIGGNKKLGRALWMVTRDKKPDRPMRWGLA